MEQIDPQGRDGSSNQSHCALQSAFRPPGRGNLPRSTERVRQVGIDTPVIVRPMTVVAPGIRRSRGHSAPIRSTAVVTGAVLHPTRRGYLGDTRSAGCSIPAAGRCFEVGSSGRMGLGVPISRPLDRGTERWRRSMSTHEAVEARRRGVGRRRRDLDSLRADHGAGRGDGRVLRPWGLPGPQSLVRMGLGVLPRRASDS